MITVTNFRLLLALSTLFLGAFYSNALAEGQETIDVPLPMHGVAMHGAPKYDSDFTNLDYVNAESPKGGSLKQAVIGTYNSLNHYNIHGRPAFGLNLVHDTLLTRVWDEPFSLYGLIAEKIIMPEDRSSITFLINPKARFHDGKSITAKDVLFSFNKFRKNGKPNTRRTYGLVKTVLIENPLEITFILGKGFDRETALILGMMPVLSEEWWKDKDFSKTILEKPLGSGPYKVANFETGRDVSYERVKDYWAADLPVRKGHFNFDRLTYEYFRDQNVAFEALKSGDIDLWRENNIARWLTHYTFPAIENGSIKHKSFPHERTESFKGFIFNLRQPLMQDDKIREALFLSFDSNWVNNQFFHGKMKQSASIYPNSSLAMHQRFSGLPETFRDRLKKADSLLKEAGWIIKDGIRINNENGKKFTFEILIGDPEEEKITLAWISWLKKLGITAKVRVAERTQFQERLNRYDYDVVLWRWSSTLSPGSEQHIYWGSEAAKNDGSRNYAGISDAEIDQTIDILVSAKTRQELEDSARRLDHIIMKKHVAVPLFYSGQDNIAYKASLKHPYKTPLYGTVLETWWQK